MGVPHNMAGDPTLSAAADTDRIVDAFEAAWRADEHPRIHDYLRGDGPTADELLVDLAEADLRWRLSSAKLPASSSISSAYPRLADNQSIRNGCSSKSNSPSVDAPSRSSGLRNSTDAFRNSKQSCARIAKHNSPDQTRSFAGDSTAEPDETARGPRHADRIPGALARDSQLQDPRRIGPRRHGRDLQSARCATPPDCRAQDDSRAAAHQGPDERARFLTEVQAIASLRHAGIVQVFDFGTHAGLPYFSLEFCEAGSLASRLSGTPLAPREAARLCEQLARAVGHAHEARRRASRPQAGECPFGHGEVPAPAKDSESDAAHASDAVSVKGMVLKISDFGLAKSRRSRLGDYSDGHGAGHSVLYVAGAGPRHHAARGRHCMRSARSSTSA